MDFEYPLLLIKLKIRFHFQCEEYLFTFLQVKFHV